MMSPRIASFIRRSTTSARACIRAHVCAYSGIVYIRPLDARTDEYHRGMNIDRSCGQLLPTADPRTADLECSPIIEAMRSLFSSSGIESS